MRKIAIIGAHLSLAHAIIKEHGIKEDVVLIEADPKRVRYPLKPDPICLTEQINQVLEVPSCRQAMTGQKKFRSGGNNRKKKKKR